MSFSSDLKQELSKINNLSKKEEVKCELIGYLISKNATVVKNKVRFATENDYNINRYSKLLKNLNINNNIEFDGKSFVITFKAKEIISELEINENQITIKKFAFKPSTESVRTKNDVTKKSLNTLEAQNIDGEKLNLNENCKRAIVRGSFLGAGSINNPNKKYHFEINLSNKINMEFLSKVLKDCNINCKELETNKSIYLKDGEEISSILALIGANSTVLRFEDIRVQRNMNGKVNRIVNCQTANLNKILNASVEQINAIKKLKESNKFNMIDDNLKEIALLRLEYPDISLTELGQKLKEPIGKSGVNYRLKKIIKIANEL